jgi:hypothetical protein
VVSYVDTWVVLSGAVALLLCLLTYGFQMRGVISRLKWNHHVLWLHMDCLGWWVFAFTRSTGAIEGAGSNRINVSNWLNGKEYLALYDRVLTGLAQRQLAATRVGITIAAILVGYGLLRYFGVIVLANTVV